MKEFPNKAGFCWKHHANIYSLLVFKCKGFVVSDVKQMEQLLYSPSIHNCCSLSLSFETQFLWSFAKLLSWITEVLTGRAIFPAKNVVPEATTAKADALHVAVGKNLPAGWSGEAFLRLPQSFAELTFCSDPYRVQLFMF